METQNQEDIQRHVLYHCREMSLSSVPYGYIVAIEDERKRFFTAILEAWTNFIDTLDARGRRRIKEYQSRAKQDKTPLQRLVIYHCREVSLSRVAQGYIVAIAGERERFFTDVLEAWTNFIDTLDARARRRIKEYLKKEGERNEIHC